MTEKDLDLLLNWWTEAKARGEIVSAQDLCRDRPDLLSDFEREIAKLSAMAWLDVPEPKLDNESLAQSRAVFDSLA